MRLDYKWRAAIVVAIGLFMAVLDSTIVNVALPQMQTAFQTDRTTITWVVTAYFLAQAAVIPITGYVSDRLGSKFVYAVALAFFTVGSALCAFTPQIQPYVPFATGDQLLIAFRVLQGIGGGALFPTAFAIIFRIFPPVERGPASAIVGVPVVLAPAFGPTIGGYLTTSFDWSAIFTVNIPIGIVAFILVLLTLKGRRAERALVADDTAPAAEVAGGGPTDRTEPTEPARKRFDIVGLVLAMAASTALVYGITQAGPNGWDDTTVDAFLIAGGVLLVAFVITELLVSDPVIDVRLFLNYTFASANVLTWAVSGLLFGSLLLLPIFFETVQGKTPLDTGVVLILQGIAGAVGTALAGRFYNRVGPRVLVALGFALITAGTYGLSQLDVGTSAWSLQGWLVLRGLGLGFTNIPLQTLAVSVVSNRAMARASSLINVTRQVFGAVGISVLTTYFTQQTKTYAGQIAASLQTQPPTGIGATCVVQAAQGGPPGPGTLQAIQDCVVQHSLTLGLNDTFWVAMLGTAVCIVLALLAGRDPALVEMRRARKRGEAVKVERPVVMAE